MNIQTLKKLASNPHYRLTSKQMAMLAQADKKPMIEFGVPSVHNNRFDIHDTNQKKKKRGEHERTKKQSSSTHK